MPEGVRWSHVVGVGFLTGVGVPTSIFVGDFLLGAEYGNLAKVGILGASAVFDLFGFLVPARTLPREDASASPPHELES